MDVDYADDIVLRTNIPPQAEFLLNRQKQAAEGIGLHENSSKTEYMCFNREEAICLPSSGGGNTTV